MWPQPRAVSGTDTSTQAEGRVMAARGWGPGEKAHPGLTGLGFCCQGPPETQNQGVPREGCTVGSHDHGGGPTA